MAINEKLRRERKYQNLTALDMARTLNIAESSYWQKEAGSRPFIENEINIILKKLNKKYEEIFGCHMV